MRAALAASFAVALPLLSGCAGGAPLLHPAHTLDTGVVSAAAGVSANVAVGSIAEDLQTARNISASDPNAPGPPGTSPAYAKGALVAAAVAPGLAPFVAARVGIGGHAEGGVAYTGRAVRIDVRRSLDLGDGLALSAGAGVSVALYGREQGTQLADVDLGALHGYGADVPVLFGWRSDAGLYEAWVGARGGFENDTIDTVTSEPKTVTIGVPPIHLGATRYWAGGLVGLGTGFRHVHVALELDVAYQSIVGDYNQTHAAVSGVALAPAAALWWTF